MNVNTVVGYINGTKRNQIPSQTLTTANPTIILAATDTGTAPAVLSIPTQTAVNGSSNGLGPNVNPAILVPTGGLLGATSEFNSGSFDGRPFKIRFAGTYNSGVAANGLTIGLYLGTSATVASNVSLGGIATATNSIGVVKGHFLVEGTLIWDSASQKLDGTLTGFVGISGAAPSPASVGTAYTTQATAVAPANLQFVAGVAFALANAANSVQVTDFSLDLV